MLFEDKYKLEGGCVVERLQAAALGVERLHGSRLVGCATSQVKCLMQGIEESEEYGEKN